MQDKYQQGLLFKMSTSSTESSSVRKLDKETFSDIDLSKVRLVAAWADFLDCHQTGDLKFVPHAVIVSRGAGIPSSQLGVLHRHHNRLRRCRPVKMPLQLVDLQTLHPLLFDWTSQVAAWTVRLGM
jgi:hypothetical protein